MHETAPDTDHDLDALRDEVAALQERNDSLERGLHSVTRVVEALIGLPGDRADELAERRQRRALAGQQRRAPG